MVAALSSRQETVENRVGDSKQITNAIWALAVLVETLSRPLPRFRR